MTEAPQPGTASQDFEKQLALVTLPTQESLKDKEKENNPEAADQAPKHKLQIKLKPWALCQFSFCNFSFVL